MKHVTERSLLFVILALLGLTALSWGLSYAHIPSPWEMVVAMVIAVMKVSLVLLYFMHVINASKSVQMVVLTIPIFVFLLIGLVYGDVATRLSPTRALPPHLGTAPSGLASSPSSVRAE
jgi:cytochrome c oxidase subunit 4